MKKHVLATGYIRGELQTATYKGVHYASRKVTNGWLMFIDGKCIGTSTKDPASYIADFVKAKTTESG